MDQPGKWITSKGSEFAEYLKERLYGSQGGGDDDERAPASTGPGAPTGPGSRSSIGSKVSIGAGSKQGLKMGDAIKSGNQRVRQNKRKLRIQKRSVNV